MRSYRAGIRGQEAELPLRIFYLGKQTRKDVYKRQAFITHIFKQGEFLETQRFLLNNTEEEKQMGTADMVTKEYLSLIHI